MLRFSGGSNDLWSISSLTNTTKGHQHTRSTRGTKATMSLARILPSPARLQALQKLRSTVFGTTFNPLSLRTGSKILKARLRGPAMLRYYGERISGWAGLNAAVPGLELKDVAEETR